jgi:peroxiredoxin
MARRIRLCIASVAVSWLAAAAAAGAGESICNKARKPANLDFTLHDPKGKPVDLRAFRGQVILVNFWATWCRPCRKEIPWLIELFHEHRAAGFTVLGVSVDEDPSRIPPFAAAMHMSYPVLVGRGEDAFAEALGPLLGFPTTVLIARDGTICVRHTGITTREALARDVRALLAP